MIDAILNNFSRYKRRPLYVDVDHLLDDKAAIDHLIACGGYVVKTHYPQVQASSDRERELRRVLGESRVLVPARDLDDTYSSSLAFGAVSDRQEFDEGVKRFWQFWSSFEFLEVPFPRLIDAAQYGELVTELGNWIDSTPNTAVCLPFDRRQRLLVYSVKLMTRLLGNRSPIVNTTIGFAKTR